MTEMTPEKFGIEELSSLISLMIAEGQIKQTDRDQINQRKRLLDKWHLKGHKLFTGQQVVKRRKKITIDAREINISGKKIWVWVAVDLDDEMIITIHASFLKNRATIYRFLKNIAKLCKGKLPRVFINVGSWDSWAFEKFGFRYTLLDFGPGSVAETFLSIVDSRICKFIERFTDKKTPKNIRWWIEGFAGFINYWTVQR